MHTELFMQVRVMHNYSGCLLIIFTGSRYAIVYVYSPQLTRYAFRGEQIDSYRGLIEPHHTLYCDALISVISYILWCFNIHLMCRRKYGLIWSNRICLTLISLRIRLVIWSLISIFAKVFSLGQNAFYHL